jgi:hypothetical protein
MEATTYDTVGPRARELGLSPREAVSAVERYAAERQAAEDLGDLGYDVAPARPGSPHVARLAYVLAAAASAAFFALLCLLHLLR